MAIVANLEDMKIVDQTALEAVLEELKKIVAEKTDIVLKINGVQITENTSLDDIGVTDAIETAIEEALDALPEPESPFQFVTELPNSADVKEGVLYLLKVADPGSGDDGKVNICEEYVWNATLNKFEKIGDIPIEVDLDPYATKEELKAYEKTEAVDAKLKAYVTTENLTTTLGDYVKKTDLKTMTSTEAAELVKEVFQED